jgi:hypothetical protein
MHSRIGYKRCKCRSYNHPFIVPLGAEYDEALQEIGLPLKSLKYESLIVNAVATSSITLIYFSDSDKNIEAELKLPTDISKVITKLLIHIDDRTVEA